MIRNQFIFMIFLDELLEWLTRSDICPATHVHLNPDDVRRPGRIICNMISALERYCPNKSEGCVWKGANDRVTEHTRDCKFKSREALIKDIQDKESQNAILKAKIINYEKKIVDLEQAKLELEEKVDIIQRKLNVYEAFLSENDDSEGNNEMSIGINDDGANLDDVQIESNHLYRYVKQSPLSSSISSNKDKTNSPHSKCIENDVNHLRRLRGLETLNPAGAGASTTQTQTYSRK